MPQGVLRTAKKPHFVATSLVRRISRIDLTKSAFQRTLCSNPLNSEFDHYAVFELPAPESSISDQDAYFYIENRL